MSDTGTPDNKTTSELGMWASEIIYEYEKRLELIEHDIREAIRYFHHITPSANPDSLHNYALLMRVLDNLLEESKKRVEL